MPIFMAKGGVIVRKKFLVVVSTLIFLLSGCLPNFGSQDEVVQEDKNNNNNNEEKAIVPKFQISEDYYRTLTPFKPSGARGQITSNMSSRFDSDEFEEGLLRISQKTFSTDKYIFQEGQYLESETISEWIKALNPTVADLGSEASIEDRKEARQQAPRYLAHILEHNFLIQEDDKVKLAGISIGLALNSVDYFRIEGNNFETPISDSTIEKEGKRIAEELIHLLRGVEGLEEVPVTIGLFKQQPRTSIIPGSYFAYATVKSGGKSLEWNNVNEKYVLFPSNDATNYNRDDAERFSRFKEDVSTYYPNHNGVVGRGLYINDELQKISIDIDFQFYGKTEVIGFTQYIAGLVVEAFPDYVIVEINVKSVAGQEALILKKPDMKEPFVHIY